MYVANKEIGSRNYGANECGLDSEVINKRCFYSDLVI